MKVVAVVYLIEHDDGRGCGGEEGMEEVCNVMKKETWVQKQIQTQDSNQTKGREEDIEKIMHSAWLGSVSFSPGGGLAIWEGGKDCPLLF